MKFYGMDGGELTLEQWAELYERRPDGTDPRRVGNTWGAFFFVSTVLLGIDHSFSFKDGRTPIIFETMVFARLTPRSRRSYDVFMNRYATLAQAKGGHLDAVQEYTGWRGFIAWLKEWRLWLTES